MCTVVSGKQKEEPTLITVKVFAFIIVSGFDQFTEEDYKKFTAFLITNYAKINTFLEAKPSVWQELYIGNENTINELSGCEENNCIDKLLSQEFPTMVKEYTKVLYNERKTNNNYKGCTLQQLIKIYDDNINT